MGSMKKSMGDTGLAIPGIFLNPRPCQGPGLLHHHDANFENFPKFFEKVGRTAAAIAGSDMPQFVRISLLAM